MTLLKQLRASPWALLVVVALLAGWFWFGWEDYMLAWGGKFFKSVSGGLLGFWFSRYVCKLDVSKAKDPALAGLGQSLLIAAGMIAVS